MTKQGAIGAIIAFVIGIYFAIPSEANIGYMIVEALAQSSPTESFSNLVPMFKLLFSLLGVVIIIGDIVYIVDQIKKGNFV